MKAFCLHTRTKIIQCFILIETLRFTQKINFSEKMAEFVKMDCENGDVKEEYVEEEDPLRITTNNGTGD